MNHGIKSDTPFARFLTERKLDYKDLGLFRNIAQRLARVPDEVAPNSPILPPFAEFLGIPLTKLKRFATAEPLSKRWEAKIRTQLERGTLPRGDQVVPKKHRKPHAESHAESHDNPEPTVTHAPEHTDDAPKPRKPHGSATAFTRLMNAKGHTLRDVSNLTRIPYQTLWHISSGQLAVNHPMLDYIAEVTDVPLADLQALVKLPPMHEGFVARAARTVAKYRAQRERGGGKAASNGKVPGTALVRRQNGQTPAEPRAYNRLGSKRTALTLRESARAMVATLNVSIMRGDTHMPPLPVGDLYLVLQDYLLEKGVKKNVLVDPDFASLFDPK